MHSNSLTSNQTEQLTCKGFYAHLGKEEGGRGRKRRRIRLVSSKFKGIGCFSLFLLFYIRPWNLINKRPEEHFQNEI